MSHHASGPNFGFPRGDARLDITDLYAFTKPGDPARSVIVLNVHPSFRFDSPEPTTKEPFALAALYEIKVDTNGDAIADLTYSAQLTSSEDGSQTATVYRNRGAQAAGFGGTGEIAIADAPVSLERETLARNAGDHCFFFRWRSDPFFFDVNGAFNQMQFTGDDFFTDKDVCSIVVELPNSALGANPVGIWGRVLVKTQASWIQVERGAKPMQAVFLVGEQRDAYLSAEPANDDRFIGVFAHELEHLGGYKPEDAADTARRLLPDILEYDFSAPVGFPKNGRTLTDDVVDVLLPTLTNGKVTGDGVGPHRDLLREFAYLGPPHPRHNSSKRKEMKSTNDVLDHHLRAIEQGDVNAVLSDYAPDAVLFRSDGVFKGVAAIKPVFDSFVAEFQTPGTTTTTKQRLVVGDYGYMLWTGETTDNIYELATDTFVIKEGKIVAQSFTAKIKPKRDLAVA
jgi:hypothetical protein